MLELVDRGWAELSRDERAVFEGWVMSAQGVDLYMLMRHARRKWTRGTSSASQTLAAIKDTEGE
jgi:hypothetical protein